MERTITIAELKNMGVESWSVKDNSPRGVHTAYTSELKPGDKVVIDNYFTTIIEPEPQPEEAQHGEIMEAVKEPTDTKEKKVMKLNKEEFFETEFGEGLTYAVDLLDDCYIARSKCAEKEDWKEHHLYCCRINELNTALEVFQAAIKQFYGIEYIFRRTDEYYGVCAKDGSDWLFKVEREID